MGLHIDLKHLFQILKPVLIPLAKAELASQVAKHPNTDLAHVEKWVRENPQMAQIAASIAASAIHYDRGTTENFPVQTPTPVIDPSTPVAVVPIAVPTEVKMARTVKSIKAHIMGGQQKSKTGPGHPGGGADYSHDEIEARRNLSEPFAPGDRIHIDNTPVDTQGKDYEPGDPDNAALHLSHFVEPDDHKLELHSADDDNTCTPVYKVPLDYQGEQVYTYHSEQDGVRSNEFQFRVKS